MSFLHPEVVSGWRTSNIITTTTLLTLLMASGCAGTQWGKRIAYSPGSFVEVMQAQAPEILAEDLVIPFAVTPEMVVRAKTLLERMPLLHTDIDRANRLMNALTDEDEFGLVYDSVATSPPAITVERGYGNCLALTSIFIGLAREVGLVAYYVDASNRINDLRREEEIIVDSGHIAGV
ncbi:MAG: hypothetical protein CL475_04190, partial [Acidobacteria bacterium]|nr:hypothetical protein [Acidobacteriota bacterium]